LRIHDARSRRLEAVSVLLLLAATALPLILFACLDTRAPDDHDNFYSVAMVDELVQWRDHGGGLAALAKTLVRGDGSSNPPMAQAALLSALGTFGASRTVFRLVGLPFLLLTVLATYLAGRELLGHRAGLLAALVVSTLPMVVNYSRKFDIMFHAMALSALALFLALRVLGRPERRTWALWIALGVCQGLRFYTHPIVLGDIALIHGGLAAALFVQGWGDPSGNLRSWIGGYGLSLGITLAVGAWYFVPWPHPVPQPIYSFEAYWAARSYFVGVESAGLAFEPMPWSFVFRHIGLFLGWLGIHPPLLALLFVPGLLALPVAMRRYVGDAAETRTRSMLGLLALLLIAQAPLMPLTIRNYGYAVDWIGLLVPLTLLCLLSLDLVYRSWLQHRPRLRTVFVVSVVAICAVNVTVPLAWSAVGPDPLTHYDAYRGPLWRLFNRCETGHRMTTHHLISRSDHVSDALVERLVKQADPEDFQGQAVLGVWELVRDRAAAEAAICPMAEAPTAECCYWIWSDRDPGHITEPWPFVFGGFAGFAGLATPDPEEARYHAVRLHIADGPLFDRHGPPYDYYDLLGDECLEQAVQMIDERLGGALGRVEVIEDPDHFYTFDALEAPTGYAGKTVLVDRGWGPVSRPVPLGTVEPPVIR